MNYTDYGESFAFTQTQLSDGKTIIVSARWTLGPLSADALEVYYSFNGNPRTISTSLVPHQGTLMISTSRRHKTELRLSNWKTSTASFSRILTAGDQFVFAGQAHNQYGWGKWSSASVTATQNLHS